MSNEEHVNPIKPEIREIMEEFLNAEDYFPMFRQFAKVAGYEGDDMDEVRKALFSVDQESKEIIFSVAGLYDLFLEYQLAKQLSDTEPYKTLLKTDPAAIRRIRELAKKIYAGKDITDDDLLEVFNVEEDEGNKTSE